MTEKQFKIGFIAPLSGTNKSIGEGLSNSFSYAVDLFKDELSCANISVHVTFYDDQNNPVLSEQCVSKAIKDDCILLIGPADSACASHVLDRTEFGTMPILLSFATDITEAFQSKKHVFRITTPGWRRTEVLVQHMMTENPGQEIYIAGLDGLDTSFSQRVKATVIKYCKINNIKYVDINFHCGAGGIAEELPETIPHDHPIIICAPSYEASIFIRSVRHSKHKGKLYGFGSNSNWLKKECAGLTLVCDLDRHDKNPFVSEILQGFSEAYPVVSNPSVATMLAAKIITQLAKIIVEENTSMNVKYIRKRVLHLLSNRVYEGVFGRVSFDQDGEMIGYETISMLRVTKRWRRIEFADASNIQTGFGITHLHTKQAIFNSVQFIGAVAGIIGLIIVLI